jgi:serine protease Do
MSLTVGQMPSDEKVASGNSGSEESTTGVPHLGLQVAPANEVSGAGSQGVVVTAVDPDGVAAEQGFQTGTVILDVGGKPVENAGDVRHALTEAKSQGKHDVLMRVKMGDGTRFVAMPLGSA